MHRLSPGLKLLVPSSACPGLLCDTSASSPLQYARLPSTLLTQGPRDAVPPAGTRARSHLSPSHSSCFYERLSLQPAGRGLRIHIGMRAAHPPPHSCWHEGRLQAVCPTVLVPLPALCPVGPCDPSVPHPCPAGRRLFTRGPNASGAMWGTVAVPHGQTSCGQQPAVCWGGRGPALSSTRSPTGLATWPPWSQDESSDDEMDVEEASPLWLTFLALFLVTVVYGGFVTFIKAGGLGRWGPMSRARAPRVGQGF